MMLDLTPHIKIPKGEKLFYRSAQIFLALIFLGAGIILLLNLILPKITFTHNIKNTDPLYNIFFPEKNTQMGLEFSASLPQDVDHIKLQITPKAGAQSLEGSTLSVQKTYRALTLPVSTQQQTPPQDAPFAAGALIRSQSEYFVVDDENRYPISSGDILLAAGYSFDDGQDSTSKERASYKKGKSFRMRDTHPIGTQFFDANTKTYYSRTKNGIAVTQKKDGSPMIQIDMKSIEKKSDCILKKNVIKRTYTCEIDLVAVKNFPGKDYIFTHNNLAENDIDSIEAVFTLSPSTKNIESRLGLIKSVLLK